MEVAVDQRLPEVDADVEDAVEVGLKARKPRHQYSSTIVPGLTKLDNGDGESSENSNYFDQYGVEDLDIQKFLNTVQYDANSNEKTDTTINASREETGAKSEQIEEEIMEEEVVELEFEKAIPKLHTHTMHCPNCDNHITKVILRRKIIKRQPQITEEPHEPLDLLGCFSCFSLFTSTENGGFNPFPIFWNKPASTAVPQPDGNEVVSRENGNCFSIFRVFRREKDSKQPEPGKVDQDSQQPKPRKVDQDSEQPQPGKVDYPSLHPYEGIIYVQNKLPIREGESEGITYVQNKLPIREGESEGITYVQNKLPIREGEIDVSNVEGGTSKPKDQLPTADHLPSHDQYYVGVKQPKRDESSIDIPSATSDAIQGQSQEVLGQDSTSFEILKSIVYGGLMEVIASLSVVASAAAGDATTLSIIGLALANLIGGIFIIGHNLWDLRDDCYKFTGQQTNNQQPRNKYKELLGSIEHFPLHVFFAILSFLVFGIIPPVAYGYSFHETNDKDFTMVVVAAASFVCVGLLGIFKAYIDRCTGFSGYVKTIMYYLTTAVTVSSVSYVVGNLVTRLIEELGLFDTSSGVAMGRLPKVVSTNPSLAYY